MKFIKFNNKASLIYYEQNFNLVNMSKFGLENVLKVH